MRKVWLEEENMTDGGREAGRKMSSTGRERKGERERYRVAV